MIIEEIKFKLKDGRAAILRSPKEDDAFVFYLSIIFIKILISIANFKVREGMPIGVKVTLRASKMFDFMYRLFNVALPRVRDFRGISLNSFDGRGNYSMGIKEQLIFPEIDFEKVDKTRGMDISFITTAKTDEESKELLSLFGAPFKEA